MFNFLGAFFIVVGLVYLGISFIKKPKHKTTRFAALIPILVGVLLSMMVVVPNGHTGVVSRMGKVSSISLENGLNYRNPITQSVIFVNNQIQRVDVDGEAASKDLQTVSMNVAINYNVLASSSINLYKTVGKDWEATIIRPAIQESIKSVFSKYTAEELITKQTEVSAMIKDAITEKLDGYGIEIRELNILDRNFSKEFNAAIEAKSVMEQQVLTERQNLEKQKIAAEARVVAAEAEARANKIKNDSMTDSILESKFYEKWDGKLPSVVGSGSNILDVSGMIK